MNPSRANSVGKSGVLEIAPVLGVRYRATKLNAKPDDTGASCVTQT